MKFDLIAILEDAYDLVDKIYDNYDWNLIKTVYYSIDNMTDDDDSPPAISALIWRLYVRALRDSGSDKKEIQIALSKFASDRDYIRGPKEFNKSIIVPLQAILSKLEKLSAVQQKSKTKKSTGEFGTYAWAGARRKNDVPFEVDTEIERKVLMQLDKHFASDFASKAVTADSVAVLKSILKKGKYSDVIKAPTCKIIKRGMSVTKSELEKLLGKSMPGMMERGEARTIKHNFTYIPKGEISSWTSDIAVAKGFFKQNSDERRKYSIILMAHVSDNPGKLLQCDNALYKISAFAYNDDEHEIVAIGNVKISSIVIQVLE